MANRYWVGGTATWDATAGTKWALTSGGAGGQAVPTAADDVFFDAASGAVTVTTSGTTTDVARSITFTGFTGTFSHAAATTVTVGDASGGALTMVAGMTYTRGQAQTSAWAFAATSTNAGAGWTLTWAGKAVGNITYSGAGGKWTHADACTSGGTITLTAGELNTNNQSVSATNFSSSNTNTRTLTLGSSAITLTDAASGTIVSMATTTGLTISTNTATITGNGGGNGTYSPGAVNWNGTSFVITGAGNPLWTTASTIANLTRTGTALKTDGIQFSSGLTVTGTLTLTGNSVANRLRVFSNSPASARTLTVNTTVTASYVDFTDITGAGTASWNLSAITGGSGDAGGNSGITFTTAQNNYAIGTSWDSAASWSLTSGGGATGRVPLPQDTARLDANSPAGTYGAVGSGRYGGVDCTGFTRTLSFGASATWYGSFVFSATSTISGTLQQSLGARGAQTITSNGKTLTFAMNVDCRTGTYTLQDAMVLNRSAAGVLTLSSGTLATNGQSVTLSGASATAELTGGTLSASGSTFSIGSTNAVTFWNRTSATITGSPNVTLSGASANTRVFAGGGATYGTLDYTVAASTGQLSITGANTFATINVSGGVRTLAFTASTTTTITTAFNVFGTAGNLVTVGSLTAASHTLTKSGGGIIGTVDFISLSRSTATPGSTWFAGANSTDGGNNSGWSFTAGVISLIVADGAHAHSTDAIALTQQNTLAVADALHAHAGDGGLVLVQGFTATIQDGTHAHSTDGIALTQANVLSLADATHGHTTDPVALTQQNSLAVQDALHAHSTDAIALTQANLLAVADAAHAHAGDSITLTQAFLLAIQDALHAHATDPVVLTQANILAIQEALHAHSSDPIALTQAAILVVQDTTHAHAADALALTQGHILVVADAAHLLTSDGIILTATSPGGGGTDGQPEVRIAGVFIRRAVKVLLAGSWVEVPVYVKVAGSFQEA